MPPTLRHTDESDGCSGPVDVIAPFVVAASAAPSPPLAFALGEAAERFLVLLRVTIFRFKSSRSKDFSGETFINDVRLLDVADCTCVEAVGDVERLAGPFRLSNSSPGSCLIGINEIEGVILVSCSIRLLLSELEGALEFESPDWGDPGQSPLTRCDRPSASPLLWPG